MKKFTLALSTLLVISACASPREQCVADATRDLRVLRGLANETRANLNRGYAVEEEQVVEEVNRLCRVENEDGTTSTRFCEEIDVRTVRRPVAINLEEEAEKLASLERRIDIEERQAQAAVAQCQALPD